VIESAQPFLVATIAKMIAAVFGLSARRCAHRSFFFESLSNWISNASFLPEAEFAAVENILPDPEIAAERLALLSTNRKGERRQNNRHDPSGIGPARPQPRQHCARLRLKFSAGRTWQMPALLNALSGAGYERVAQVTTRGQFAVRGGIVDIFSWQTALPLRIEFYSDEIESLREFDLDTQTSVRTREQASVLLSAADDISGRVRDYITQDALVIELEPESSSNRANSNQ